MVWSVVKTKCLNDSLSLIWQHCGLDVERPQHLRRNARDGLPAGVEKRKPTPGRVLRGARYGVGSFLLAQTTTDCPRVDLEELSCAQPVTPRILKDCSDDCVVQFAHTSAKREGEGKVGCISTGITSFAAGTGLGVGVSSFTGTSFELRVTAKVFIKASSEVDSTKIAVLLSAFLIP